MRHWAHQCRKGTQAMTSTTNAKKATMHKEEPSMKDSSSTQQSQGKPKALIVISSGKILPLSEPSGHPGIPTGFFLVEMAQVLKEFENDYEFTFATPDGKVPQLDINSMSLAMHAIEKTASAAIPLGMQQRRRSFDADSFRRRHSELAARREQEIAEFRPELIRRLSKLPEGTYHSLQRLVERHRDPADAFTFADFDFIHAPGGHAPMVDFRDNPWL